MDFSGRQSNLSEVSFSIFGTCVSRDIVDVMGAKVNRFIQDISPINASCSSPLKSSFKLNEENLAKYLLEPQLPQFHKRNILLDMNKDLYKYFFRVKSDWVILDMGCLRFRTLIGKNDMGVTEFIMDRLKCKFDKNEFELIPVMQMDDDIFAKCMDKYISAILKEYEEDKIIVIEQYLVNEYVDSSRIAIHKFKKDIRESNAAIFRGYDYLRGKLKKAHFIPFLSNVLGDEKHKWGKDPLHYVKEYYEYGSEVLKVIVEEVSQIEENNYICKLRDYYRRKIEIEYLRF